MFVRVFRFADAKCAQPQEWIKRMKSLWNRFPLCLTLLQGYSGALGDRGGQGALGLKVSPLKNCWTSDELLDLRMHELGPQGVSDSAKLMLRNKQTKTHTILWWRQWGGRWMAMMMMMVLLIRSQGDKGTRGPSGVPGKYGPGGSTGAAGAKGEKGHRGQNVSNRLRFWCSPPSC